LELTVAKQISAMTEISTISTRELTFEQANHLDINHSLRIQELLIVLYCI